MEKRIMLYMGLLALTALAACDKIDPDKYTVYDGAAIVWTPGTSTVNPVQRVLVEKFTGPRCNNCPLADSTLSTLESDNVVIMSINHPSGQGLPLAGEPDLRTTGGTTWDQWYGISAIPSAFVDRDRSQQFSGRMATIGSAIATALNASPLIAIEAEAQLSTGGTVEVTVDLSFVQPYTHAITLTAAIVEDSLAYKQILPDGSIQDDYVHNHMLRQVITGYWGRQVDCQGTAGENIRGTLRFSPDNDIQLGNSHIVVFVSDKTSRRILNCASATIH
ncbi:MAG: Omp28-related outer membrane protein [Bacteroidales bacterium]|nr:Omp28-related outer membrane protein [Bacteroidales bacterium]